MKTIQPGSAVVLHAIVTTAGEGEMISGEDDTLEFVCGQNQIFAAIEAAVLGKAEGDVAYVQLEPEEHVGDYDAELVRVEDRQLFPDSVEEGMLFEGLPDGVQNYSTQVTSQDNDADHAKRLYLVTDVTDEVVVLDGNHPLAGIALKFKLTVRSIDPAPSAAAPESTDPSDPSKSTDPSFAPNFQAISRK